MPKREPSKNRPPGRRPVSEGDAELTRRQIRTQAIRLFNERGYTAVSIDDIVAAAKITRTTLYYHYEGKSDIFLHGMLALVEFASHEMTQISQRTDLPVPERLARMVHRRRELEQQPSDTLSADLDMDEKMLAETMPHLSSAQQKQVGDAFNAMHGITQNLMREGVARGELRDLPVAALDYAFWQLIQPQSNPQASGLSREQLENFWLEIFFNGTLP